MRTFKRLYNAACSTVKFVMNYIAKFANSLQKIHPCTLSILFVIGACEHCSRLSFRESVYKGWEIMATLVITFPPSKNFESYLRRFMEKHIKNGDEKVKIFAKHCLIKLGRISVKGPRGKVPTVAEVDRARVKTLLLLSFLEYSHLRRRHHFIHLCLVNPWLISWHLNGTNILILKSREYYHF